LINSWVAHVGGGYNTIWLKDVVYSLLWAYIYL
jgi:hypothetical protein